MRLLLAEDERSLSRALTAILEHNKYSVDPVYDGEDALYYIENGEYDGAILDIMMPKMDGIEVLKRLREEGNLIPVIMLTAKSELDDKILGLDSGANDYMTKPFEPAELLARIRAMTRTKTSQADSVLKLGNITLDRTSFKLKGPAGDYTLANKEFQVMELLMKDPGVIISADSLMDKVWGYDSDADINVVWVYISYIRKKLKSIGADVEIKAKRNSGYYVAVSDGK